MQFLPYSMLMLISYRFACDIKIFAQRNKWKTFKTVLFDIFVSRSNFIKMYFSNESTPFYTILSDFVVKSTLDFFINSSAKYIISTSCLLLLGKNYR